MVLNPNDPLAMPKKVVKHEILPWNQPLVLPEAILAIAVLHHSADPTRTIEDQGFDAATTLRAMEAVARNKAAEGTQGRAEVMMACRTRSKASADSNAWKEGLSQEVCDQLVEKEKNKLKGDMYRDQYSKNHFSQLTIKDDDELSVWSFVQAGAGSAANGVPVVTSQASAEDVPGTHEKVLVVSGSDKVASNDAEGLVRPFFIPLAGDGGKACSVFEHIFDNVMDCVSKLFSVCKLPRPKSWGEISARHLRVMASLMADLHKGLQSATRDASKLILKAYSSDRLQSEQMLDDGCIDWMLECLIQAVGSRMVGVKVGAASPLLTTNTNRAEEYFVFGVSHSESLRRLVSKPKRDVHKPLQVHEDDVVSWNVPGESDGPDEALRRCIEDLGGAENVKWKQLLLVATCKLHTKLVHLASHADPKDSLFWRVTNYDSLFPDESWDTNLRLGMTKVMVEAGLMDQGKKFQYHKGRSADQGDDEVVCGLMAFINTIQVLTGETLAFEHSLCCCEVIRVFFDLWYFKKAESDGAIRPGYLAEVLKKAVDAKGNSLVDCAQRPRRHA
jgi:hypothetical protein